MNECACAHRQIVFQIEDAPPRGLVDSWRCALCGLRFVPLFPPASPGPAPETMSDETKPREIVYWDCDETAEVLEWETLDEAIEHHLDGLAWSEQGLELSVYGWARKQVTALDFSDPLNLLLESIRDNEEGLIGEDEGADDKATPAMREAAKAFLDVVVSEFQPWCCEVIETRTVNVREWLAEKEGLE